MIEAADRKIDSVLVQYASVPITSPADEVKRLSEQWAAGLFLQADAKNMDDFRRGRVLEKIAREGIEAYGGRLKYDRQVVETTEYATEPLSSE